MPLFSCEKQIRSTDNKKFETVKTKIQLGEVSDSKQINFGVSINSDLMTDEPDPKETPLLPSCIKSVTSCLKKKVKFEDLSTTPSEKLFGMTAIFID